MAEPRRVGPKNYLEESPTPQTVRFGSRYINLKHMAEDQGMNHSYLSYILSGQRTPSIPYAQKVADALGMGLEELLECIKDRKEELRLKRRSISAVA